MIRIILSVAALALFVPGTAMAEDAASANRKGVEAYNQGNFDESVEHFTDAIVRDPESDQIRFNRGTAMSASGNREEAVSELSRAAADTDDPSLAAGAYYNAGNTLLQSGELDGAIDQYKKAVKLDQTSQDIRHNFEMAVRMRDQQQQQQQNQDDQQNQDQDEQQQDDQQQNDQQQQQSQQEQQQGDQEQVENPPDDSHMDMPMSREEAERILDAIENEEREALANRNEMIKAGVSHDNDW